jgi:hypothetical protein
MPYEGVSRMTETVAPRYNPEDSGGDAREDGPVMQPDVQQCLPSDTQLDLQYHDTKLEGSIYIAEYAGDCSTHCT